MNIAPQGSQNVLQMINESSTIHNSNSSLNKIPSMKMNLQRTGSEMSASEMVAACKASASKAQTVLKFGVDMFVWGLNEGG